MARTRRSVLSFAGWCSFLPFFAGCNEPDPEPDPDPDPEPSGFGYNFGQNFGY